MMKMRKPPPDYSIQKLRAYEEKLNDLRGNVSEAKRKEQLALWEAKSTLKAQRGLATAKLDELQWREDRDLARRRQALSKKLQAEDEALRQELSVTRETADERRAKLAEQATALAEARERRRREEADKLLTRAFRENYDPIRQVDSKLKTQRAAEERRAQVAEKLERRAQQEQEAAEWARVWDAQREKMEQRYHDDKDKEKKLNQETMRILDEQMSQYRARLARERQEEEDEIAALKEEWARQEEEDRRRAEEMRQAEARRVAEVMAFNAEKRQMDQAAIDAEREEDLKYLEMALSQAKEDADRDRRNKETKRRQMMEYRAQLEQLALKEKEDSEEQDRLIQEQNKIQQAKHDVQKRAEEEARQALMREVVETRAQQLQWKYEQELMAMEEVEMEAQRLADESARLAEMEEEARHRLRLSRLDAKEDLKRQIETKRERIAAERAKDEADDRKMYDADAEYKDMIDKIKNSEPPRWYGRRKVDWFY